MNMRSDTWISDLDLDARQAVGRVGKHLELVTGRIGVAFSGGVDSSVLLALAVHWLGPERVTAIMGVSPSLAASERDAAHDVAAFVGAPLIEVQTNEGDRAEYIANGPDRCFHCKDELFERISEDVTAQQELSAVAYGENADDAVRPDRFGARAATNHAVMRPLAEAGMRKETVRNVARALGLPCADKPASPCLASRIPHFSEVTPEKLAQVEEAEGALRQLGFTNPRVRHHGEIARIELPVAELVRAASDDFRFKIRQRVQGAGFRFVTIDLGGIQSGAFTLQLLAITNKDKT